MVILGVVPIVSEFSTFLLFIPLINYYIIENTLNHIFELRKNSDLDKYSNYIFIYLRISTAKVFYCDPDHFQIRT